jgi:hypothetical protein
MSDSILRTFESPDGLQRVIIVRRADGLCSYRRMWRSSQMNADPDSPIFMRGSGPEGHWAPPGPYCGVYDTPETAEAEASGRVPWMAQPEVR